MGVASGVGVSVGFGVSVALLGPILRPILRDHPEVQIVIAGKEQDKIAVDQIRSLPREFSGRVYVSTKFISEGLVHRIFASNHFFLNPALFEPCGLTQMFANHYGSLPRVRRVGGLADTVQEGVNGFVFDRLIRVLPGAVGCFHG